uniref:Signal-induced proliferation-associated 1-like protein C-terminal domain-containing protein n=1 Tax=Knipowitschia caucasica TaxID=637954 RepID=A0AAV2K9U3_KNICA
MMLILYLLFVCSPTARTPVTPAVTPCQARPPAGATATLTSGSSWGLGAAPVGSKANPSPMAWEEGAISRAHLRTAASTLAPTALRTCRTRTMAAPTSLLAPERAGTARDRDRSASPWHSPTEGGRRMLERSPAAAESPGPPPESREGRTPPTHLLVRDASTYSLSDICSNSSSSSRHSAHSSPREESSPSATSPSQASLAGPKSFYPRQGAQSKYLIGWRKPGSTINSVDFGDTRKKSPGESSVDLIPTPAARPSLRDMHSPQPHSKSLKSPMEEEPKRQENQDSPPRPLHRHKEKHGQKSPPEQPLTRRRSLHRTLSDESIYRGQRLPCLSDSVPEQLAADVLFSCSTLPRSPTTRGVPLRRPSYKLGVKLHGDLSASDTSLVDLVERHRGPLPPDLMPLPSGRDSPLEWTHLVDVASTFDSDRGAHYVQRSYVFGDVNHRSSGTSPQPHIELQPAPLSRPASSEGHIGLERKVTKLEAMVKMLQEDLKKEREEKQRMQAQIKRLWEENQRLQEESQTSAAKLKKFTEWVFNTIDMN